MNSIIKYQGSSKPKPTKTIENSTANDLSGLNTWADQKMASLLVENAGGEAEPAGGEAEPARGEAEPARGEAIMVLDPATSTGYCICRVSCDEGSIIEHGIIDVDVSSRYQGDHCIDLMSKLKEKIELYSVKHIAVEDYFFSSKCKNGSTVNVAFRTAIHVLARSVGIGYTILSISSWKKHIAGRATATVEQKKAWKTMANKYFIQQAILVKWGIKFPNHCVTATGKIISAKSDVVDAVGQSIYYMEKILNVKNIKCEVVCPPDVINAKFKNTFRIIE